MQKEAAEDVAQEVLLLLHEKYPELDRIEDLLPLSLEIARFKIVALRRKIVRRGEHSSVSIDDLPVAGAGPDPFDQAARGEHLARLESILRDLGERCRELVRLKLQGHTFPEIQKLLKVDSLNTLYTWDFRCRKQIMERWQDSYSKSEEESK